MNPSIEFARKTALAYGAGASLRNMEFIENWNVPKLFAWEGQTGMLPYGARFLNGEGEDFMRRYSPKLGAKADPHYNVRGMAFEVRAGRVFAASTAPSVSIAAR